MKRSFPILGDQRIKSWFAFVPVTIGKECRWLEWVTVRQVYRRAHLWTGHGDYWDNDAFVQRPPRSRDTFTLSAWNRAKGFDPIAVGRLHALDKGAVVVIEGEEYTIKEWVALRNGELALTVTEHV